MHDNDFHTGDKPQEGLKGGHEAPNTQAPQTAEAMTNPRSAGTDNIGESWASTSLKPGHTQLNPSNDKNKAH
ncbi:hypothetical protein [Streptomyces formicae]|uniref:Uncharacterized protein n=1 Tax=Streptomyces formicae TaxID=1616117 RepID=A0ABY3WP96_9ACTN|nr:hypothetical protein [Streptomyces formicae]UNM12336.1 hypothetical protein J4032_13025 [Streptomyces formicae]